MTERLSSRDVEFRSGMDKKSMAIYVNSVYVGYLSWHDGLDQFVINLTTDLPMISIPRSFIEAVEKQIRFIEIMERTKLPQPIEDTHSK